MTTLSREEAAHYRSLFLAAIKAHGDYFAAIRQVRASISIQKNLRKIRCQLLAQSSPQ